VLVGFTPITDIVSRWASPDVVEAIAGFSVMTHFDGFQKGVIDSRDFLYFISIICFSLFTTDVIIRSHRAG